MDINQRITYFTSLLTYKALHGKAPKYVSEKINLRNSTYNTRDTTKLNLTIPKPNLEIFKKSFTYCAPSLFNKLPHDVTGASSVDMFKKNMKKYLSTSSPILN